MREPKGEMRNWDSAKRFCDTIRLHQSILSKDEILAGRFVAIRLADGGSDGVVYNTRAEAITAQRNSPSRCGYFQIPFETWTPRVCDSLLWYVRACYDAGNREDPAHQLIMPTRVEDVRKMMR